MKKGIKVYIPVQKGAYKGNKPRTRGFWQGGKVLYYDYMKTEKFQTIDKKMLEKLKVKYRQEAIFYETKNLAFCYYNKDKIEVYNRNIRVKINQKSEGKYLRKTIKKLVAKYGGLTCNIGNKYYNISIWKNPKIVDYITEKEYTRG